MIGFERKTLSSERLTFRLLNENDKNAIFKIVHEPETTEPAGFRAITENDRFEKFWNDLTRYNTGIAILLNGECIGYYHVNKRPSDDAEYRNQSNVMIGFIIGKEFQRQGYAAETLHTINEYLLTKFDNIWGDYFEGNAASKRALEKCGFKPVGAYDMEIDTLDGEKKHIIANVLSRKNRALSELK